MKGRYLFAALVTVAAFCLLFFFRPSGVDPLLEEANSNLKKAENATNPLLFEYALNRSLADLLELEHHYAPTYGNGNLYIGIGDLYAQLNELPLAVYYYEKASLLRPSDSALKEKRDRTLLQLGREKRESPGAFASFFFFFQLAIPRQLQLLFFLTLTATILAFLSFYSRLKTVKVACALTLSAAALLILGLGYQRYLSPIEAVIISGTPLFRTIDKEGATVNNTPLFPGEKVRVIAIDENGRSIKVALREGEIGYISHDSLRIL